MRDDPYTRGRRDMHRLMQKREGALLRRLADTEREARVYAELYRNAVKAIRDAAGCNAVRRPGLIRRMFEK